MADGFTVTGMDLVGYMATDVPRAIAFYRDVIGLKPTNVFDENAGAEFELSDGSTFGLWSGNESMPFQPSNCILFAVDDFDAAVERLKSKSVPIVMQHESPVCFMVLVDDTEGNKVILHKRKPS
jgi:predicted enzyme related to lactoylglutathione lyase